MSLKTELLGPNGEPLLVSAHGSDICAQEFLDMFETPGLEVITKNGSIPVGDLQKRISSVSGKLVRVRREEKAIIVNGIDN